MPVVGKNSIALESAHRYDVVVTFAGTSITSDLVLVTLVQMPQVGSIEPSNAGITWLNKALSLSAVITNWSNDNPMQLDWAYDGTNLVNYPSVNSYSISVTDFPTNEGTYNIPSLSLSFPQ